MMLNYERAILLVLSVCSVLLTGLLATGAVKSDRLNLDEDISLETHTRLEAIQTNYTTTIEWEKHSGLRRRGAGDHKLTNLTSTLAPTPDMKHRKSRRGLKER